MRFLCFLVFILTCVDPGSMHAGADMHAGGEVGNMHAAWVTCMRKNGEHACIVFGSSPVLKATGQILHDSHLMGYIYIYMCVCDRFSFVLLRLTHADMLCVVHIGMILYTMGFSRSRTHGLGHI